MKKFSSLSSNFLSSLTNGGLKINFDDEQLFSFKSTGDSRILDIIDVPIKLSKKPGLIKQLSEAKSLAKKLNQENVTFEIRLKGDTVLKLGKSANPKLAKIVTMSSHIEIKDLKKLKKLSSMI